MTHPASRCPHCFEDRGTASVCPRCGAVDGEASGPLVLPPGTLLAGQYRIGKVLGHPGGFGITYLTWDEKLQTRVAVKEFFPREFAGRDRDGASLVPHSERDRPLFEYGLDQFLEEARRLARFDHANIVRVRTFFEANGTGYLVMDYYEGESLAAYLERQPGERLDEHLAVGIMVPVLDGLREVHAEGMLHRDIDPHNIYLTTRGRVILLDFGAARMAVGDRSQSLSVILKPGYAPYEQYATGSRQGPWTDVYACAATLYRLVTGAVPPDALNRILGDTLRPAHELEAAVSPQLSAVLQQGLAVRAEDRPQTAEDFQSLLPADEHGSITAPQAAEESATPPEPHPAVPAPQRREPDGAAAGAKAGIGTAVGPEPGPVADKHPGAPRRRQPGGVQGGRSRTSGGSDPSRGTVKRKDLVVGGTLVFGAVTSVIIGAIVTGDDRDGLNESVSMLSPAVRSHLDQIGYRPTRTLLHEDFSSNRAGWRDLSYHEPDHDGSFEFRGGRAYLTTGSYWSNIAEVPVPHGEVAMRVDVRHESGGVGAFLLTFWSDEFDRGQWVRIELAKAADEPWYRIRSRHPSHSGDASVSHADGALSALINPGANRVELIATRNTLRLFLNGTHLRTVSDIPEMRGEWLDFEVLGEDAHYSFANLVMVELEHR